MRAIKAFISKFAGGIMIIGLFVMVLIFSIVTSMLVFVAMLSHIVHNNREADVPFQNAIDESERAIKTYCSAITEIYHGGLFEQK